MCGIAGFWSDERNGLASSNAIGVLNAMGHSLAHRGPDDNGVWVDRDAGVGLAHTRLAVLELSPAGAQPMTSHSGDQILVFNGEIYNHRELRDAVEASRSVQWRGQSDTETLLAAFGIWGVKETLKRCVGMFALALWDRVERRLFLARDRMGEKPLYYGWCGPHKDLVFGSELKSLRVFPGFEGAIDRAALQLYFQFSVVPSPFSIYRDVFKLSPGCFVDIDCSRHRRKSIREQPYWDLSTVVDTERATQFKSEADALASLDAQLGEAVALQMVADVPVGAFLSGGIDSSTIVALMQARARGRVKTFTVGFEEAQFDESGYAAEVARYLNTDHYELRVTPRDAQQLIPQLPFLYDEPFADSSQLATMLVCRAARERVTVALSGDGGDELFGGYERYVTWSKIAHSMSSSPRLLRNAAARVVALLTHLNSAGRVTPSFDKAFAKLDSVQRFSHRLTLLDDPDELYRSIVSEWSPSPCIAGDVYDRPVTGPKSTLPVEERMMFLDSIKYLPDDILTKVDRAAMGVSLETRAPFLDHRVVELSWRIPKHMKIKNGTGKWLLRQLLHKYVPKELVERPKAGFSVPIGTWLRGPLREWAESLISPEILMREGYLSHTAVTEVWRQHLSGRRDHGARLWSVLMFQAWLAAH